MHAVILKSKPSWVVQREANENAKKSGNSASNPQEDVPLCQQMELFICCHVRKVDDVLEG
jgi:hypothetical protein